LQKSFGSQVAVAGLTFSIEEKSVVGFLGPNGAGKTTTLRMLSGFLEPTAGSARIRGWDVVRDRARAQALIGYMPEAAPCYPEMRVDEYLKFRARLKAVPGRGIESEVGRVAELSGVAGRRGALIRHLSKGFRQRLGLADALLGRPPLVILDEPTAGLDPNQIREVREVIRDVGREQTVFLSTHILPEVEMVCDRAVVIHRGRAVANGTLAELTTLRASRHGVLTLSGDVAELPSATREHAKVVRLSQVDSRTVFELQLERPERGLHDVVAICVGSGLHIEEVRLDASRLEDVFAALTLDAPAASEVP